MGEANSQEEAECKRGRRLAAISAAALIYLAGRRRGSADTKATGTPTPKPDPPELTPLGQVTHWLTWPIRKTDQAKRELEEQEEQAKKDKPPEPVKDTCGKKLFGCVTIGGEAPTDTKADAGKDEGGEGGFSGIIVKVLGAIATGVGVTGAVVVIGATIFWARFDAIGVPPIQAVTAIPRTELLVQGAQEVTIFVLVALVATLFIGLADPKGVLTRGSGLVLCLLVGGAFAYAVIGTTLPWGWVVALGVLAAALAVVSVGIGFATEQRLLPLLVSVFIASFVFSASCAFLIVENQKYAQAIAIRFGPNAKKVDEGITGIYVTATEKTIFYARADTDNAANVGLYEVPRAETTTYAVGPLEPIERKKAKPVEKRAKALLQQLKEDAKSFPATVKPDAGKKDKETSAAEVE